MNENKYYAVKTICGHVRKNNYIEITFGVIAKSGCDAASIARKIPRVKHDRKDAIISVVEITYDEYLSIRAQNENDPYLKCQNKQEQNINCVDLFNRIIQHDKEYIDYKVLRMLRLDYLEKKRRSEKKYEASFRYAY